MTEPTYLGDGAYVKQGSYVGEIVIFTHNGIHPTNSVVLGPSEIVVLERFLKELWEAK